MYRQVDGTGLFLEMLMELWSYGSQVHVRNLSAGHGL